MSLVVALAYKITISTHICKHWHWGLLLVLAWIGVLWACYWHIMGWLLEYYECDIGILWAWYSQSLMEYSLEGEINIQISVVLLHGGARVRQCGCAPPDDPPPHTAIIKHGAHVKQFSLESSYFSYKRVSIPCLCIQWKLKVIKLKLPFALWFFLSHCRIFHIKSVGYF